MSNPLLQPRDDRFARPNVIAADGINPFSDAAPKPEGTLAEPISLTSPPPGTYVVTQPHRALTILVLGGSAILGHSLAALALMGVPSVVVIFSLLAVFPAVAAWILGARDLNTMRAGVMDPEGASSTRTGMWLGVVGTSLTLLQLLALLGFIVALIIS